MPEKRTTWITTDGSEFDSLEAATAYEDSLNQMNEVRHFLSDVLQCSARKHSEYYSVFKQFFVWSSGSKAVEPEIKEAV